MLNYNIYLKKYSKELRKNMTDAENILWSKIRCRQFKGYQFYRQKPIGDFIVDFYCPKAKLVIEVDGGQHYTEEMKTRDDIRDNYMQDVGLKVIRFSDTDIVDNLDGVLERIWNNL